MSDGGELVILLVSASASPNSAVAGVMRRLKSKVEELGAAATLLDLAATPLPLLDPLAPAPEAAGVRALIAGADVLLVGTPDYHGSMSGCLKNFFDHGWREFSGKLVGSVVGSHDRGLTVADHIRTVARQCYAWTLPYSVPFVDKEDFAGGQISSDAFNRRLDNLAHDAASYGRLLARQRKLDLAGSGPGFMAHYRSI